MLRFEQLDLVSRPIQFSGPRTSPGYAVFHAHQGMEYLYVQDGLGRVTIEQRILPLSPGTLAIFPPFHLHGTLVKPESSPDYTRWIMMADPSHLDPYLHRLPNLQAFHHYLWRSQAPIQVLLQQRDREMLEAFFAENHRILTELQSGKDTEAEVVQALQLLQLIKLIWPNRQEPLPGRSDRNSHHAQRVLEWIDHHYAEAFRLEDLAAKLHVSKYHLCHLFKDATGTSIVRYLQVRRIREACLLLRTTKAPIEHIAYQTGFGSFSRFCSLFKQHMGVTPLQYRHHAISDSST